MILPKVQVEIVLLFSFHMFVQFPFLTSLQWLGPQIQCQIGVSTDMNYLVLYCTTKAVNILPFKRDVSCRFFTDVLFRLRKLFAIPTF